MRGGDAYLPQDGENDLELTRIWQLLYSRQRESPVKFDGFLVPLLTRIRVQFMPAPVIGRRPLEEIFFGNDSPETSQVLVSGAEEALFFRKGKVGRLDPVKECGDHLCIDRVRFDRSDSRKHPDNFAPPCPLRRIVKSRNQQRNRLVVQFGEYELLGPGKIVVDINGIAEMVLSSSSQVGAAVLLELSNAQSDATMIMDFFMDRVSLRFSARVMI
ncbi:MAG: hypothetical protein M3463_01985 [Verrucomicrobiota bacterium]|nr:hypothetical protein [Verrucomicrobiota bacterium]